MFNICFSKVVLKLYVDFNGVPRDHNISQYWTLAGILQLAGITKFYTERPLLLWWQFDLCESTPEMNRTDTCNESHLDSQYSNELIPDLIWPCATRTHTVYYVLPECQYYGGVLSSSSMQTVAFHLLWSLLVVMDKRTVVRFKYRILTWHQNKDCLQNMNSADENYVVQFMHFLFLFFSLFAFFFFFLLLKIRKVI